MVAQKFIKSGRPRKLSNVNDSPCSSVTGWVIGGAVLIFCFWSVEPAGVFASMLANGDIMPPTQQLTHAAAPADKNQRRGSCAVFG